MFLVLDKVRHKESYELLDELEYFFFQKLYWKKMNSVIAQK